MLRDNLTTAQFQWISIELKPCEEISDSAITTKVIGAREVMLCKYKTEQVAPASIAVKRDTSLVNALNGVPNHEPMLISDKRN
jgi:hypothetical protein